MAPFDFPCAMQAIHHLEPACSIPPPSPPLHPHPADNIAGFFVRPPALVREMALQYWSDTPIAWLRTCLRTHACTDGFFTAQFQKWLRAFVRACVCARVGVLGGGRYKKPKLRTQPSLST